MDTPATADTIIDFRTSSRILCVFTSVLRTLQVTAARYPYIDRGLLFTRASVATVIEIALYALVGGDLLFPLRRSEKTGTKPIEQQ